MHSFTNANRSRKSRLKILSSRRPEDRATEGRKQRTEDRARNRQWLEVFRAEALAYMPIPRINKVAQGFIPAFRIRNYNKPRG